MPPSGPLAGVRVIEVAGLGAGPYTAMMLADFGVDVIRVDRPGTRTARPEKYALSRGRRSDIIDMKQPDGLAAFMTLVERADVLLEGFRPGVAERLGFGPTRAWPATPGWSTAG